MSNPGEQISFLIHGATKVGKSTLANTAPAPRLLLDAEAASRFLTGSKVRWDPTTDAPPVADGSWDTCEVIVLEYAQMIKALEYLESGQHGFESVVIDSISAIQQKLQDQITGSHGTIVKDMDMQKWGRLLSHMEALMRQLRDFTEHPTRPVNVVITAMTETRDGVKSPLVKGGLRELLPSFMDVIGFLDTQEVQQTDPTVEPEPMRYLATRPTAEYVAGERVRARIPRYVYGEDLSIERMIGMVFGHKTPAAQSA